MGFQSKSGAVGSSQSGPVPAADNVVSIDDAKSKAAGKGGQKDKGEAKPKPPTIEHHFASYMLAASRFVLGRQAQGETPDTTLYSWKHDRLGARWERQDDKVVRGTTTAWLRKMSPSDVSGHKVGSCIQILRDVLIDEGRTLAAAPKEFDVVPLRNAYLLIEKQGEHKGRILAVKPCPSYGQTSTIQADLDWERVDDEGIYIPQEPKEGGYWHRYLSTTFPHSGVYAMAQEALSMALLSTCYEKAVWLYGGGENGKSCLLHILRSLAPNATAAINISRLARNEFGNNQLISKRIAVCSEMPKILTAEVQEILKGLVSRDPTQGEYKGRDAFTFIPEATFFFATNHHPIMPDHEHGWWRKVLTLPFPHRVKKEDKIIGLDRLITDDPGEMIQVIDWLLIGGARLTQRGRFLADEEMPEPMRDLALAQRMVSDPVAAWIYEHDPKVDEGVWTNKQAIYDHFKAYTEDQGRKPVAQNAFWLRIGEHFRDAELNTQGQQVQIPGTTARPRHIQLLVPDIKPTRHDFAPTKQQLEQARKNPPETIHGSSLPDMPEAFQ
jgi:P4 family phage/plasmid primase-like protien